MEFILIYYDSDEKIDVALSTFIVFENRWQTLQFTIPQMKYLLKRNVYSNEKPT